MDSKDILKLIGKSLNKHKAQDITVLKIDDLTVISDYFVIASGTSNTQVRALAGDIEEDLRKAGVELMHTEGYDSASWILLDFGGVIVHLFLKDSRMFYSLEHLWSDAKEISFDELLEEEEK